MFLLPIFLIISVLPFIVYMAPADGLTESANLEMCNFLAEKSVFSTEKFNAFGQFGKLLMEMGSTSEQNAENAELEQCLAILRVKVDPNNLINFNLLEDNRESDQYKDQMQKLEHFFLNGRQLMRMFVMRNKLKYSNNFWTRFFEANIFIHLLI